LSVSKEELLKREEREKQRREKTEQKTKVIPDLKEQGR